LILVGVLLLLQNLHVIQNGGDVFWAVAFAVGGAYLSAAIRFASSV
jgi:hypothetical protein